jgi:HD-like signal output (HDOD) protein/CheY-like chemotaxis protein
MPMTVVKGRRARGATPIPVPGDAMPRILLVHDDARTLERALRSMQQRESEWEVRAARSEAEALVMFDSWAPQVVAAAAKPPLLDGIGLLALMRDKRPQTIRIVIGVEGDTEKSLRTLKLAHRAVSEPLDATDLIEMIRRMLLLTNLVAKEEMRELLGSIGGLPAVPSVYAQLATKLEDSNTSVFELGRIVAGDMTLAAQVLRLANSAYFSHQQRVTKIEAAAARLGTRLLRSLVLTAEVYGRFPVSPFFAERLERMQSHASLVARIASGLDPGAAWREDAFTAALLHDIGKLVLGSQLAHTYEQVVVESERTGDPEHEVELRRLGVHHGAVGACLLGMWGLPSVILEAVQNHHDPIGEVPKELDPVLAVKIADRLAHSVAQPMTDHTPTRALPSTLLDDARWPQWLEMAAGSVRRDEAA